jgi:hypothetical protein
MSSLSLWEATPAGRRTFGDLAVHNGVAARSSGVDGSSAAAAAVVLGSIGVLKLGKVAFAVRLPLGDGEGVEERLPSVLASVGANEGRSGAAEPLGAAAGGRSSVPAAGRGVAGVEAAAGGPASAGGAAGAC